MLRSDYGSTWRGTITVKDCTINNWYGSIGTNLAVFGTTWTNHYYGYVCYMPNLVVDNLKWENIKGSTVYLIAFSNEDDINKANLTLGSEHVAKDDDANEDGICDHCGQSMLKNCMVNENPYISPDFFKVINNKAGITYKIYNIPLFKTTKIEGIEYA